jgi:hypothetical protein
MSDKEFVYLERLCAWLVYQIFDSSQDGIDKLSSLFVEYQMLKKIDDILDTDAEFYYKRLDANVFAHDVANKNRMKNPGDVAKSMKTMIRQILKQKLKDDNESNKI